jgi:hypothetical protein
MKNRIICVLAGIFTLSACDEKKEVTITETRPPSTRDASPKLFATSDERFRDAKPSPVKAVTPEGWLALPSSQFRLLNYRFGESGMGEVWVSTASGTVLDNVNRWFRQFAAPAVDSAALAKMPSVSIVGSTGTFVTAVGSYEPGMGGAVKPGFALAGIVASVKGQILTVKMVGPQAEVEAAKPILTTFAASLQLAE